MFGQHLRTINIIYIVIGIIIIVSTTNISADNARPQTGAYFVYNQIGLNQPNKLRKLYWYTMGQPILTARKQRMGNFQLKPRYQNSPLKMATSYVNPMRSTYRNAYDAAISANTLKSYITPVSMSTTAVPKIVPSFRFQPSKQYEQLPFEDTKSCTEKNLTISEKESRITVPQHLRPLETPSQYKIPLIAPTLPIVPYVSHTYFTLDDVVIPSSSDNLLYYKPERQARISKDTRPTFTTPRSILSNNLTFDVLGSDDLFDIVLEDKPKEFLQTTMSWMPVATTIVENQAKRDIKTTKIGTVNQTLAEDLLNIISEYKSSTSLPEIETIPNIKEVFVKSPQTTTLNPILNDVDDKLYEEPIEYKAAKIVKENSLKNPTSTSFNSLLATKMKIAQNHKKFLPITSKKISYSTHSVSTTTTTTQAPQLRKSRRIKTYSRQRKVDSNFTRLSNYNLTNAKSTYTKILRPTLKTNSKQKIQNTTEIPLTLSTLSTSISPETKTTTTVRRTPISTKSISSTNFTETTALAAESAIMTISNANGRNLRGSIQNPRFRKRLPEPVVPQKVFVHTTAIPQLPIELYFNKLTKSQ